MNILVTGTAGFIGFHIVKYFTKYNCKLVGLDNINDYYPVSLKYDRLEDCGISKDSIKYGELVNSSTLPNYSFIKLDLEDTDKLNELFDNQKFDLVIHLAAQAGVRYSIENPKSYIKSNIEGFINILEGCRNYKVPKLVYASSSSVYGISEKALLSVTDRVDEPISLYAATKKANELMAYTYSHLYGFQTVGLRFFTVYGPWGRPDMAPFLFADSICNGKIIKVFNKGKMKRDFTFINDIVKGVNKISYTDLEGNYHIYNMGNSSPVKLNDFISCLENEFGQEAKKELVGMQPGDVVETWADVKELTKATGYKPDTSIESGVSQFVKWYKAYYQVKI
jgi:UDP-glucuronate 4-epimerase